MTPLWNAHVKVKNSIVKNETVGLGWGVTEDVEAHRKFYETVITLTLPEGADATVTKTAPPESVVLKRSASLTCGPAGIEANVSYRVSPLPGATGSVVRFNVAISAGEKAPPAGGVLAQGTGQVGQDISVDVVIPGSCA
jgi:hypothetical protein